MRIKQLTGGEIKGHNLGIQMLKRLLVLLFILTVAGQASAGICNCVAETKKVHSCCKRARPDRPVFNAKGCCEQDCAVYNGARTDRTRVESSVDVRSDVAAAHRPFTWERPLLMVGKSSIIIFVDQRIKYPRPPNLYLFHQAFLI